MSKKTTTELMAERVKINLDHLRVERGWEKMKMYEVFTQIIGKCFTTGRDKYANPQKLTIGELSALSAYFRKPIAWFFAENG